MPKDKVAFVDDDGNTVGVITNLKHTEHEALPPPATAAEAVAGNVAELPPPCALTTLGLRQKITRFRAMVDDGRFRAGIEYKSALYASVLAEVARLGEGRIDIEYVREMAREVLAAERVIVP